jgi:hypothetical protein
MTNYCSVESEEKELTVWQQSYGVARNGVALRILCAATIAGGSKTLVVIFNAYALLLSY